MRQLWNNSWRQELGTQAPARTCHRIEVFDGVISDESSLHSATSVQQGRVPRCCHFVTHENRGVRDRLRRHAAVLAT